MTTASLHSSRSALPRRWLRGAVLALLCGATLAPLVAQAHGRGGHVYLGVRGFYGGYRYPVRVVGPRIGWWGPSLPVVASVVTVGGLSYWYADGYYYRAVPAGGYEVVAPPVGVPAEGAAPERLFVYARDGQSAERQASDEYECHRWAAEQSGYDPTAVATGSAAEPAKKGDYSRAQAACLDGRGYTVR